MAFIAARISVWRGRPPGFAAGINGPRRRPLRIGQIARQAGARLFVILSMRLRPHPESKPPSYHGSRESRRYRQRQKLLGQALSVDWFARRGGPWRPAFLSREVAVLLRSQRERTRKICVHQAYILCSYASCQPALHFWRLQAGLSDL